MPNPTKQLIPLLIIATLLLIACTPLQLPTESPLQTPTAVTANRAAAPDEIAMIGLKRSGCYGFCPAYELTIFGDGRVVYRGGRYVDVEGVRTSTISTTKVHELLYAFGKIDFFTLNDRFAQSMTDIPTFTLTLQIGERVKQVEHYGCPPQELIDLEYMIDEITNSAQWIGSNAYTHYPKPNCADYEWSQPYSPLR